MDDKDIVILPTKEQMLEKATSKTQIKRINRKFKRGEWR